MFNFTARKRSVYLFCILCALFGIVVFIGYAQIANIKKSMEDLLVKEAEIIHRHLAREIDLTFGYLDLIEHSNIFLTQAFLDLITYEEVLIEELLDEVIKAFQEKRDAPVATYTIFDSKGFPIERKGKIKDETDLLKSLLSGKDRILFKMKEKGSYVILGFNFQDRIVILSLTKDEMLELKRKSILKKIVEREMERLKLKGINIYDADGRPYYIACQSHDGLYRYFKRLESNYFRGYSVEILLTRNIIDETIKRMSFMVVFTLFLLLGISLLAISAILFFEKRLKIKMIEIEKEKARNERLMSLGLLSSAMAHEIRNPLNAISLSLKRLGRDFLPNDSRRVEFERFLGAVEDEVLRINRIVEEFIVVSKKETKEENLDLKVLMDDIILVLEEKAKMRGVELQNLVPPGLKISGRRQKLKQAFINVILNGIEATENGGFVKIDARKTDKGLVISIKDSGCGIDREDLEKIFEYHYSTKEKGLGLGLPISYAIFKDHGAEIKVESMKGKGTKVSILFPN